MAEKNTTQTDDHFADMIELDDLGGGQQAKGQVQ